MIIEVTEVLMDNENQLIHARKEKLRRLLEMGTNPFPTKAERTHHIKIF